MLAQRADEIVSIDDVAELRFIKVNGLTSQRGNVDALDGSVDGVGNQKLFRGCGDRVGRSRRAAANRDCSARGQNGGPQQRGDGMTCSHVERFGARVPLLVRHSGFAVANLPSSDYWPLPCRTK